MPKRNYMNNGENISADFKRRSVRAQLKRAVLNMDRASYWLYVTMERIKYANRDEKSVLQMQHKEDTIDNVIDSMENLEEKLKQTIDMYYKTIERRKKLREERDYGI